MKLKWLLMNQEGGGEGQGAAGGSGEGEGESNNQQVIDPAEYAAALAEREALRQEKEKLKANNASLMQEKVEAKKLAEQAKLDAMKKAGDLEAFEKSLREQKDRELAEVHAKYKADNERLVGRVTDLTVGRAITDIAANLALNKESIKPLKNSIEKRLRLEFNSDGEEVIRVLDENGKPTAMSLKELEQEFRTDPSYSTLVAGSKGSGSGFNANRSGSWSGGDGVRTITRMQFENMNNAEKAEFGRLSNQGKARILQDGL